MNAETAQVDDLQLVALPNAVNCAEMFARFTLAEWSLRALADAGAHAVSTLVAAAVDDADSNSPGFVTVRLRLTGESLVIEIEDGQQVRARAAAPAVEGSRTGVESMNGRGRRLWCEVRLPTGMTASAVPLPQREPRRSPTAERMADEPDEIDPEVMQRLLSSLSRSSDDRPR